MKVHPYLLELYDNPRLAVIVQENYMKYEATIDRTKIHCTKQSLFNYHISMRSYMGFYLMPMINDMILILTEARIPKNWRLLQIYENGWINTNASQYTSLKFGKQNSFRKIEWNKNHMIPLTITHIDGAIVILIAGYIISFIIFLLEIFVKCMTQRYRLRLISYLDSILDP